MRYAVDLGGPLSSVSVYWKIEETVLKHFVRGWMGGWMSERNSEKVTELVMRVNEWMSELMNVEDMLVGRKEGRN